ncbi:IclR family transcriptional regulator [Novosphingobium colocasiae]
MRRERSPCSSFFSAQQKPLTVGEISKLLKIPQPSVTMLIRNLMALGYIEQDRFARTYTPTIRIALLGSWIHQAYVQDRQLEWRLSTLFNAVGGNQPSSESRTEFTRSMFFFLKPEMPNRFDVQARMARPLAASAVGQALLSLKPEQEIRGLVHRANDEVSDPRFRVNPQDFMTTIEQVRARGFAETRGEVQDNIAVIAMPIRTVLGQSPIAVAVGGVIEKHRRKTRSDPAGNEKLRFRRFSRKKPKRSRSVRSEARPELNWRLLRKRNMPIEIRPFEGQSRSMIVTLAMPPPSHIVCRP